MKTQLEPYENIVAERDSRLANQASYIIELYKNQTYRQNNVDILSAITVERILGCMPKRVCLTVSNNKHDFWYRIFNRETLFGHELSIDVYKMIYKFGLTDGGKKLIEQHWKGWDKLWISLRSK